MVRSLATGGFGSVEFSPDFWAWTLTSGRLERSEFLRRVGLFSAVFEDSATIAVDTVTGDEDRVVVQFRVVGTLLTGAVYRQTAAFMVEFDARGRVRHWREYFDARIVAELLLPAMKALDERRADQRGR